MPGASYTRRYARHLLLSEIGDTGQARLCATRVHVPNAIDARAAKVAREYLGRAGLELDAERDAARASVELVAVDPGGLRALAGRAELEPAAAALAGAFAAVEAIKSVLAVGTRAALPIGLTLAVEVHA